MNMKKIYGITITLLIGLGLFTPAFSALQPKEVEDKYGGTLIWGTISLPSALSPASSRYADHLAGGQAFNSLCRPDWDLTPRPELAQSWEVSPDRLTWTFHLVENATWHDGVPFTSADVKYTVEELLPKYHGHGAKIFKYVDRVETPDKYTAKIIFTNPSAAFASALNHYHFSILPKHVYEGTDYLTNPATTTKPIGTGPFIFEEYVEGSHVTYVRNPNYWRTDKDGNRLPYLDKVIIKYYTDSATATLAILAHEVDYFPFWTPLEALPYIKVDPTLAWDPGPGKPLALAPEIFNLILNCRGTEGKGLAPLENIEVRRAIGYAVDKEDLKEKVFFGLMDLHCGPIPPGKWYDESIENPDNPGYVYDPERAEKMLDEAGYPRDPETGIRFELKLVARHEAHYVRLSEMVKENLREVGIKAIMTVYDSTTANQKVFVDHDFDMYCMSWASGPDPNIGIARYCTTESIGEIPYTNGGAYSNPKNDELWDQASVEFDEEKRWELFSEIQHLMTEEAPFIWIGMGWKIFTWNKRLVGVPQSCENMMGLIDEVYWEPMEPTEPTEPTPSEPFPTLIVAVIVIIAIGGVALLIYFVKVRKTTR